MKRYDLLYLHIHTFEHITVSHTDSYINKYTSTADNSFMEKHILNR